MKKLLTLVLFFLSLSQLSTAQNDTIINCHDSIVNVPTTKTFCDTIVKPRPPVTFADVHGEYISPSSLTIGDAASENATLAKCKRDSVNELNLYARAYLKTATKRNQLAAFVRKAKTYGVNYVTVDYRGIDELPYWDAYYREHATDKINMLTEIEPYRTLLYTEFFAAIREGKKLADKYGFEINVYEGWMGNNYAGGNQAAHDSIVKYCNRVYLSNYLKESEYTANGGAWDGRMDKRTVWLALSAKKLGKSDFKIVEIISLEMIKWGAGNDFLGNYFAKGSLWDMSRTKKDYSLGSYSIPNADIMKYTEVIGRTHFMKTYLDKARP